MRLTVAALLSRLTELSPDEVCVEEVTGRLADGALDVASLTPFLGWRDDKYARHLVHRCGLFDVLVLCWEPGQTTPVHNHSGQLGWVRLVQGTVEETTYRQAGGGGGGALLADDIDDDGVGHGVVLETTGRAVVGDVGTVVSVDRVRAIHRLGNPDPRERTVTLHVYSRPHDSCLTFDPEQGTCRRATMSWDSVPDGLDVPRAVDAARALGRRAAASRTPSRPG